MAAKTLNIINRSNKDSSPHCQKMLLNDFIILETAKSSSMEGFSLIFLISCIASSSSLQMYDIRKLSYEG